MFIPIFPKSGNLRDYAGFLSQKSGMIVEHWTKIMFWIYNMVITLNLQEAFLFPPK